MSNPSVTTVHLEESVPGKVNRLPDTCVMERQHIDSFVQAVKGKVKEDPSFGDLVASMLAYEPELRPTFEQLSAACKAGSGHPFLDLSLGVGSNDEVKAAMEAQRDGRAFQLLTADKKAADLKMATNLKVTFVVSSYPVDMELQKAQLQTALSVLDPTITLEVATRYPLCALLEIHLGLCSPQRVEAGRSNLGKRMRSTLTFQGLQW